MECSLRWHNSYSGTGAFAEIFYVGNRKKATATTDLKGNVSIAEVRFRFKSGVTDTRSNNWFELRNYLWSVGIILQERGISGTRGECERCRTTVRCGTDEFSLTFRRTSCVSPSATKSQYQKCGVIFESVFNVENPEEYYTFFTNGLQVVFEKP